MNTNIFTASKFAKEEILKSIDKSTTVQKTGDVLVNFECNEIIFNNIEKYTDQGYAFHYIYRYENVELQPLN